MKYNLNNTHGPQKLSDFITSAQKLKIERELDSAYAKLRELVKENKELRTKIEQKINSYKESVDYNRKIVAILAHDLRSPFNSITGFLEIIKSDQEMHQSTKSYYIDLILSVANNALEMLDLLLYWMVNRNESKSFEPVTMNLRHQIEEALLLIRPNAIDKKVTINNSVSSTLNITADINILQLIIRNLTFNAVKFTRENGVINIKADTQNDMVEISISDNGIGFDSEYLNNLLSNEAYETNETKEDRWKGLGLMLCKDFIEIHGGLMKITSDNKVGTTVVFTIPQRM